MKRLLMAVLVTTAACGLITAGAVQPAAAVDDPYPESDGWMKAEFSQTIPAGYACRAEISDMGTGHVRIFTVSKRRAFLDFGEDARETFTNTATGKKVTVDTSGDGLVRDSKSGKTEWVQAFGGSTFYGKGIRGIVYADGVQKLKVTHADGLRATLHLKIVNGDRRQLCTELGTKAVKGRNLAVTEPSSGPSRASLMRR